MEEVDQIILLSLKSIESDLDDSVTSCRTFDTDNLFKAVVRCLQVINPDKEYKSAIPRSMSARVHAAAELAQTIKDMGYRGDLGYHQLLYPTENDTRNLLNWLTSKLPRPESDHLSNQVESSQETSGLLQQAIESKLKALLKESWSPFSGLSTQQRSYHNINKLFTSAVQGPFPTFEQATNESPAAVLKRIRDEQDFITRQPPRRIDVIPSLLEYNSSRLVQENQRRAEWESKGLESGLNPTQFLERKRDHVVKQMTDYLRYSLEEVEDAFVKSLAAESKVRSERSATKATRWENLVNYTQDNSSTVTPQESEEEVKKRREEELAVFEGQITDLKNRFDVVSKDLERFRADINLTQASIIAEDKTYESLYDRYRVDSIVFEQLLPDAQNNIKLLQEVSQKSAERLIELAKEWEQHRSSLIDAYRKFKAQHINRKGGTADLLRNIKDMRLQMKELDHKVNKKDERYKEILEVYRQLPKNINRSVYTSRILEIVRQVKKQKIDINKILLDTRTLQKEINVNIDTLGRTFAITSEVIYLDAKAEKKENTSKRAYKDIVTLHEKFKELSDKVTEAGSLTNQVLDLEEKLCQIQIRAGSVDLERITSDLDQVKQENQNLMKKLTS